MRPEDRYRTSRFPSPRVPQRDSSKFTPPQNPSAHKHNQAAANVVRGKINSIYDESAREYAQQTNNNVSNQQQPAQEPQVSQQQDLNIESPYSKTQTAGPQPQADQWKQYHTAWQDYYQKYYERYYLTKVHEATSRIQATTQNTNTHEAGDATSSVNTDTDHRQKDALYELRHKLRKKVSESAKKVRSSHHFMPIAAALVVVFIFVFLQYNRVIFANVAAYVSPGAIDPQNLVVDPMASVEVGPEPKLIIPKINVDVPVVYGIGPDHESQMAAMEEGVAHFAIPGANSTPGQIGNTVISGHSSNDLFDSGDYKFIFAQLDKLNDGDMIYANYEGVRYSYTVTKKEVVMPTEVDKLIYDTGTPVMTLITCTPLGTAEKRLLVTAEQVSPDPTQARPAKSSDSSSGGATMPGNSPTLTQRLFGR